MGKQVCPCHPPPVAPDMAVFSLAGKPPVAPEFLVAPEFSVAPEFLVVPEFEVFMAESVDGIMERASGALAKMHYLECEGLCMQALTLAREAKDWGSYARILLPLQESRRQRRMQAADGVIRLGSEGLGDDVSEWLEDIDAGCLVVTGERSVDDAAAVLNLARERKLAIEVLYAENPSDASDWTMRSFAGPVVSCPMGPPANGWLNQWMQGTVSAEAGDGEKTAMGLTSPAQWFLDACEKLGDVAILRVPHNGDAVRQIEVLEEGLRVMTDHEKLHQRLAEACSEAARG